MNIFNTMNNARISFLPTQADLDIIEEWLIAEDMQKPFSGFYCNWKTAFFLLAVKIGW